MRLMRSAVVVSLAAALVVGGSVAVPPPASATPVLGGQLYATGGEIEVEVLPATAGLTSQLYLLEPVEMFVATNREVGRRVQLGRFEPGAELLFGIRVGGHEFRMGSGERNPDAIPHASVDFTAETTAVVGFEDLYGGGDRDYDDNVFRFDGGIAPQPPPDPEPEPGPEPVANAGQDQTVDEGSVVTLDGAGSQAGSKPVLSASERAGTLPGGTSLGVRIVGLDADAPAGELRLSGRVEIGQGPAVANTSVAYVVDVSGSSNDIVNCGGDANGDGRSGTVLDCEVAAVIALHQQVVASGTVAKVGLISFNTGASARDLDPTSGSATLVAPNADRDGNGVLDLVQVVRTLRQGGGTAFAPPTRAACQLLATSGSTNLVTAFMSDGEANDVLPPLPCNPAVTFQTFAVGAGSSCTAGSAGRGLDDIALRTGGTCRNVPNVDDLPDILPEIIASRLTRVTYTVDDADPVDVSADLGLPTDGPVAVPLAFALASVAPGAHRICVTVTGTDSGGESGLTTCSELVMVTGELSYRWRPASSDGPPVVLTAGTGQRPSFVATDDGTYVFELEVTDGLGGTATDQVSVTVRNAAPVMTIEPGDAYAGGVTQVNGTFTDPGWVDTHTATLDWGDGTTQQVPVSTQGSGWGTFFGSHVYRTAGTYQLTVTLTDDDGGQVTRSVGQLQVRTPAAVWANSTAARSLNWGGGSGTIQGQVHTNGELRFVGAPKTVTGGTTYAGSISADTTRNSFDPAPVQVPVQPFPMTFAVADHRPGGPVANEIGPAYHDMTAACADGTWHEVQTVLPDGVYYAPCPIQLNGSDIGGRVTLVSESTIKISGSRPAFEPYLDGLLLLSGSNATRAIDIATSSSKFLGVLFAGSGEISLSGSGNRFYCGILGDRIEITGSGVTIRGAVCGRPDSTVSGPVLVPDLTAGIIVDRDRVLPAQTLGYDLTVSNDGATLVAPALVGLENVDAVSETVDGHTFALDRLDATTGQWQPLATAGDDGFRVDVRPNPFPGVTYPADGGVAGTTLAPGGWATWGLQAVLDLTADEVVALLDPEVTAGIRTRVDFQVSPGGAQARRLYTYGSDFIEALRALSGEVTDANATFLVPSGDAEVIAPDAEAGLGAVAPGESVTVHRTFDVPVAAPRGAGETDAGYLARLQNLDGTALTGGLFVLASGGVGRLVAPLSTATSTRSLPVVKVTTTGPSVVTADTTADYAVALANVGSAAAEDLAVEASAAGTDLPVTGAPDALAAGELASAATTYRADATPAGGTVPVRGTATWTDDAGNTYGESGSTVEVTEQTPARLRATLADMLVTDAGSDGATSPGDTIRYTLVVRNAGDATMSGVTAEVRLDPNSAYVDGSGVVQNGTVTHEDGVVHVTLPDVPGSTARTVTFDVTIEDPFAMGLGEVSAQGTVRAAGQDDVLTDDLTVPGPADPTATPVIRSFAALSPLLSGRLVVDADGTGTVTAGDTIAYRLEINSVGTQVVTAARLDVPTPEGVTLVAGSVESSQGTITPGEHVAVALGQLGPLSQIVVQFRLRVDDPLAGGITAISTQARLVADQIASQLSDDPASDEVGDPTVLLVGRLGGGGPGGPGGDGNGPTIGEVAPAEGTIVTEPVHITATLTPRDGQTLGSWVVDHRRADDTTVTVIGSGTGASVDAVLDPTVLPNGTYIVTIRGTTSIGGLTTTEITVVVDGAMKLGRYTTTITDLTVGVGGLPIGVQRTYDSFDKSRGDFGVGWNLVLADFRVSANGPLGDGGWSMQACGGGLIFVPLCFTSDRPHFVTVTWPDGHNEYFDLTPAQGSTFFRGLTSARFTARAGSTSTLAAMDNSLFWVNGNLNGGPFGIDGAYNPTTFVLTDKYGTKYTLGAGTGLSRIEDRTGNVTTFTRDGITSSQGPAVTFTRNGDGAITQITGPDGRTVQYGYDAAGDLVSVTNQLGKVTTLRYLANHYLDTVTGPDAAVLARYEYQDGRIVAVVDGEGNRTEIGTDVGTRQESVTDPGGKRITIRSYDERGLLIRINEIFDQQNHVTEYAYDANRNVVLERDPAGHEWHATYQNGNVTSTELPSGAKTTVTYNSLGEPLTLTDPEGHVTRYAWNPDGTLASVQDELGHTEAYSYTGGRRTGKVDRNGKGWAWTYTPSGLLRTERDPLGNVTTHEYDANGRETAVVDPLGYRTETTYDAAGNRRTSRDADGRVTENVYDDLNRLVRTIDPAGATVDFTLDDTGLVQRVDNHVDLPTTFTYDDLGRQTSHQIGSRTTNASTYDGAGNLRTSTDGVGRTTTHTYYPDGKVHTTRNPAGGVTTYTYTPDGQVATETDPRGKTTHHAYWPSGRLRSVTDPLGHTTSYAYDAAGRLTLTTFADGTTKERQYDAAGRLTRQIDAEGDATTFEYDHAGRILAVSDGENRRTEVTLDAAGRMLEARAPDGSFLRRTYSAAGLLQSRTTAQGVTTTYGYDPAGRRTSTTDELSHVWSTTYDGLGRILSERDPRQQGTGPATVTNVYDGFGNLGSTTDALGNRVSFGYDDAGQRTTVTDPRGKTWRVDYDALGDVLTETDPLGWVRTSTYDNAGLLRTTVDARGTTIDYGYDDAGRLTSMAERAGAGSVAYTYDAMGRRASMVDTTGRTTWEYYPDGTTRRVSAPAGVVSYAYDSSGLRTLMTTPAGSISYTYDQAGRLDTVVDADRRTFDVGVDSDGRFRALARPNGVTTTWTYDDASRLTGVTHQRGGTVVDSASYVLDADGNRTRLTTPAGAENYTLDAIDQLTSVTYPNGTATTYTYDPAGNRLTSKIGSAAAVTYTYDDASQLTSVGGTPVTHDRAGHVTSAQGTQHDWDWLGRMVRVDGPAVPGGSATYTYDGDGVRVGQDTASGPEQLLYDRVTTDGTPDLVQDGDEDFLHLLDGVVEVDGASVQYLLADGLGSVRAVTAGDGSVAGSASYDVFGAVTSSSGARTPFGFTGAPQSGDLVHLNVRDLNTSVGRFLSSDPIRPGAPGSVGWNQYTYVANNPATSVDPSGQYAIPKFGRKEELPGGLCAISIIFATDGRSLLAPSSTQEEVTDLARQCAGEFNPFYDAQSWPSPLAAKSKNEKFYNVKAVKRIATELAQSSGREIAIALVRGLFHVLVHVFTTVAKAYWSL
jgi:RHS repeat-associated protein/uncharacterized repeat protein (TIGR01451 family)